MGYVVDKVEEANQADGADRADGTDETDMAEMALRMNAPFYFDSLGHKKFKNIAYDGLQEPYDVTVGWMDGWDGRIMSSYPLDCYDYQSTCGANNNSQASI